MSQISPINAEYEDRFIPTTIPVHATQSFACPMFHTPIGIVARFAVNKCGEIVAAPIDEKGNQIART